MESFVFLFIGLFAAITIYRVLSRRATTPKARVTAMLRRYGAFARTGLPEAECLFRLMATRSGWKDLPHGFLRELVARLQLQGRRDAIHLARRRLRSRQGTVSRHRAQDRSQ